MQERFLFRAFSLSCFRDCFLFFGVKCTEFFADQLNLLKKDILTVALKAFYVLSKNRVAERKRHPSSPSATPWQGRRVINRDRASRAKRQMINDN